MIQKPSVTAGTLLEREGAIWSRPRMASPFFEKGGNTAAEAPEANVRPQ
jgi:hypothetical protein